MATPVKAPKTDHGRMDRSNPAYIFPRCLFGTSSDVAARLTGQFISNATVKTYASCWDPAARPEITLEAMMVCTSFAAIATIDASISITLPNRTKYLLPKISERPPERGSAIEIVTLLAETIQL